MTSPHKGAPSPPVCDRVSLKRARVNGKETEVMVRERHTVNIVYVRDTNLKEVSEFKYSQQYRKVVARQLQ